MFLHFHIFEFFVPIVSAECLFVVPPGLCPLSPCRAWLESAMRGSAGINLGNLISGAVVPALNISISLGWLAGGAGAGPVMASSWGGRGEGSREGGRVDVGC